MGAPPAALLRRLVPGPRDRAFFFFGMPLAWPGVWPAAGRVLPVAGQAGAGMAEAGRGGAGPIGAGSGNQCAQRL